MERPEWWPSNAAVLLWVQYHDGLEPIYQEIYKNTRFLSDREFLLVPKDLHNHGYVPCLTPTTAVVKTFKVAPFQEVIACVDLDAYRGQADRLNSWFTGIYPQYVRLLESREAMIKAAYLRRLGATDDKVGAGDAEQTSSGRDTHLDAHGGR